MSNSQAMLVALDRQDLAQAQAHFQAALVQDSPETLLELGEYLEAIGFYSEAKTVYLQLRADYPFVNLSLAQMASEDGQVEEAFLYLQAIEETSEDYLTALLVMADLYDQEGLTDVARDKLALACQLSDEPLIRFGLAELEFNLENYELAIQHYASLDNRDLFEQTGVSTYQRIGRAYANLGKFEPALDFLEKAQELEPDDQTLFELATLYYELGDYQRANLSFKQLETLSPDFVGYEYLYALSLQADHQFDQALRLVQQALTKNAYDNQLLYLASQLAYESHQADLARTYLEEALKLDPQDEEALLRLSTLYLDEEDYEALLELDLSQTESSLTKWNLAKAQWQLDDIETARTGYEALVADLADNPEFLADYAQLLQELGQHQALKEVLTAYLAQVPDDLEKADWLLQVDQELSWQTEDLDDEDWSHPCSCCLGMTDK